MKRSLFCASRQRRWRADGMPPLPVGSACRPGRGARGSEPKCPAALGWLRVLALVWAALVGVSCQTVDELKIRAGERDPAAVEVSERYARQAGIAESANRWWEGFESDELNGVVSTALDENLDVSQAVSRLRQAALLALQSGALMAPTLGYDASGAWARRRSQQQPFGSAQGTDNTESYQAGFTAGYEIDLWGRLAAQEQSALAQYEAGAEDLASLHLTVAAEVVSRWLGVAVHRRSIALVEEQLETDRRILELIRLRFRNSQATALDVLQQEQAVARTEALIPPLQAQEELERNELAILIGADLTSVPDLAVADLPGLPSPPAIGIPVDLVRRRPDVRATYQRLRSGDWDVAGAQADRLPTLRLTGAANFNSAALVNFFETWLVSLGAGLAGPILDGERRELEEERTREVVRERVEAYRASVLGAVKEVNEALAREHHQRAYLVRLEKQLSAARATMREAMQRYSNGLETYLPVLNARNAVHQLERSVLTARYNHLRYRVQLHRALGGDWETAAPAGDEP